MTAHLPIVSNLVLLGNGITMHYVSCNAGKALPTVLLLHGWPESWYSYRHIIKPIAAAGYHVVVPDMRGYGDTDCPREVEAYSMKHLTSDMACLLDSLHVEKAIMLGHDFGGVVSWTFGQLYPDRLLAVGGINTPKFPHPPRDPVELMRLSPGVNQYRLYFQEVGVAEAEFDRDPARSINIIMRSSEPVDRVPGLKTSDVLERGGFLKGLPDDISRSSLLTQEDLEYYASRFRKTGFAPGLNWYRNISRNWVEAAEYHERKIMVPALMVTTGKDAVLRPQLSHGMESSVPNLTRGHIEHCGHWTMQERPQELVEIILKWLATLPTASEARAKL